MISSFHSPVETSRVIGTGIDMVQEGRIKLSRLLFQLGVTEEIPYPDISTKAKAQAFIGMDVATMKAEKAEFMRILVHELRAPVSTSKSLAAALQDLRRATLYGRPTAGSARSRLSSLLPGGVVLHYAGRANRDEFGNYFIMDPNGDPVDGE